MNDVSSSEGPPFFGEVPCVLCFGGWASGWLGLGVGLGRAQFKVS